MPFRSLIVLIISCLALLMGCQKASEPAAAPDAPAATQAPPTTATPAAPDTAPSPSTAKPGNKEPAPAVPPPPATVTALADAPVLSHPKAVGYVRHLARGNNAYLGMLRLEPGAAIPEHADPTEEYIHILEGSATMTIDGASHTVTAGTTIFMPAGARVSAQNGDAPLIAMQVFAGPEPAAKYDAWKPGAMWPVTGEPTPAGVKPRSLPCTPELLAKGMPCTPEPTLPEIEPKAPKEDRPAIKRCRQIKCANACPNGFAKDKDGCPTCRCKPDPFKP